MHLDLLCLHVVALLRQGHLEVEAEVQVAAAVEATAEMDGVNDDVVDATEVFDAKEAALIASPASVIPA